MREWHDSLAEYLLCMLEAWGSIPGNSSWKDQVVGDTKDLSAWDLGEHSQFE